MSRRTVGALAAVVFALAAVARLTDLAVFVGPDEFSWVTRPARFFWALSSGDLAATYQTGHPGVFLMWVNFIITWIKYGFLYAIGGQPDLSALVGPQNSMALLATKRWELAFVNSLMVVGIFLLGRRVLPLMVAWLGALLVAWDPFFLSEARQLRTEAPAAGLMLLSVLAFLTFLRYRKPRYVWLAGVLAGLAGLARNPSLFLLAFFELLLGLHLLWHWHRQRRWAWRFYVHAALVCGLLPLAVIYVLWPALWVAPIETVSNLMAHTGSMVEEGKEGSGVFFLGSIQPDDPGWLFYPVTWLLRSTPLVWLGLVAAWAGLLLTLWSRRQPVQRPSADNWPAVSVLLLLGYAVLYSLMISMSALKFERYLMAALLAVDLVAAVGLYWIGQGILRIWPRVASSAGSRSLVWTGITLLVLVAQGGLCWINHPYYYTYYNPLMGGIQAARQLTRLGYGEGVDQVAAYLNAKPNASTLKLASAMSSKFAPLYKGQTIPMSNLDGRWVLADYVFVYISQLQRGKHDSEIVSYLARRAPEYTLYLQGVEYGELYPGPAAQHYSGTKLEGRGTLYGYNLSNTRLQAGQVLSVSLFWRNEGQQPNDVFFVKIGDSADYTWASATAQARPGFETAARTRLQIVESEARLVLPIGMPPGHYVLKMGFATEGGRTPLGYFVLPSDGDDLAVDVPAEFPSDHGVRPAHPLQFVSDDVALLGYDLEPAPARAGQSAWLTLYWRAKRSAPPDRVVGIRLLRTDDQEVAYWLGRPVYSGYPMSEWTAGQLVQDPWRLTLPEQLPPGAYRLELVLFDSADGDAVARTQLGTWQVR